MTVAGMIEQFNLERPNSVEDSVKMGWLRKCEANILESIILLRKPKDDEPTKEDWEKYLEEFDYDSELILKEPYDDLYIYFLDQRISLNNGDTKKYNISSRLFDNAFLVYQQKYNREHLPVQQNKQIIKHEDV